MLLYLVRHGETDWNRDRRVMGLGPMPLNEKGRESVRSLARAIGKDGIRFIYTSTVARAMETARILSEAWNAEIREEQRLNESPYERWVGKRYDQLGGDPDFELYMTAPTRSNFSSREGLAEIQVRVVEAVGRMRGERGSEKVAAVSHSDVIKPLLAHYLSMDLDAIHSLSIANASVTLVDLGGSRPRIRYVNFEPWKW
jgi:broad specificity phosphatase PhoE